MKRLLLALAFLFASGAASAQVVEGGISSAVAPNQTAAFAPLLVNDPQSFTGSVASGGQFLAPAGANASPAFSFKLDSDTGFTNPASGTMGFVTNGAEGLRYNGNLTLSATSSLRWGSSGINTADVTIARIGASKLMMHNTTSAAANQCWANSYTDSSNYEAICMTWASNVATIMTDAAGTGFGRLLVLRSTGSGAAGQVRFNTSSTDWWAVNASGHFLGLVDNNNDIGQPGATRPKSVYIGSRVVAGDATITYGPSMTPAADTANYFTITATNATAFAINAPTFGTAGAATGQRIVITIRNTSGGALGAATWNAAFKMATWTSPATGFSRTIEFKYDGTNWIEIGRTASDIPN